MFTASIRNSAVRSLRRAQNVQFSRSTPSHSLYRRMVVPGSWQQSIRPISSIILPYSRIIGPERSRSPLAAVYETQFVRAFAAATRPRTYTPWEVLDVERSASAKAIKLAYFNKAKQHHPDVNPGDKDATNRFRRCATAYELLTSRRSQLTSTTVINEDGTVGSSSSGFTGQTHGGSSGNHHHDEHWSWNNGRSAEDIFNEVSHQRVH